MRVVNKEKIIPYYKNLESSSGSKTIYITKDNKYTILNFLICANKIVLK